MRNRFPSNCPKTLQGLGRAGLTLLALPLLLRAQTSTPSPALEERTIVIMDPIPMAETESALPVTVYTVELLRKQGANTPIEGLRQLPSFVGHAATENDSNGGDGSATINLLGLGAQNTVVLVNGRRTFNFRDINALSISALSRIEVLKHGAAPVYGSDAVAGVVNFILINGPGENPYEGAELFALYGNTRETDAHVRQVYLRGGVTGLNGKVSIAAAGEYYSRANLFARDREISRTADLSNDATGLGLGGINGNSPTFAGRISLSGPAAGGGGQRVLIDLTNNAPTSASYRAFEVPPGIPDPSRFNFRAYTPAIPAVEKAMYFVTGRYKIFSNGLQLYGDILYSKTKQDNAISPTPIAFTTAANGLDDVRNSSFNPFDRNTLTSLRYRTLQELGLRKSFYDRDYYRYTVGINGDFDFRDNEFVSRFGYDTGLVYERFDQVRTDSGDLTRSGIRNQIRLGVFDPFIGQYAPPVGIAPTYTNGLPTGTKAYDNISGARGASSIGHSSASERDFLYDAKANAHLFPNWWNGGIDVAAGYERREANPKTVPDPVQASADAVGFAQTSRAKYRQEVSSWFLEVGLPIITTSMGVPWLRSLDLDVAWRREQYTSDNLLRGFASPLQTRSRFGNENPDENFGGSPRVALRYQPYSDLVLRAAWQQSIRPPTSAELFTPIKQVFPVLFGAPPGIIPLPSNGIFEGGNPAVKPETTDSYSAGIVWGPKFIPGFTLTMDAYQLSTNKMILDPESYSQVLLTENISDPDGCGLGVIPGGGPRLGVTRNINGTLDCVDSGFANGGKRLIRGVDVTAVYEIPTELLGQFTFSGGWNHFFTWKGQTGPGNPSVSLLGNFDNRTLPFVPGAIPWNKGFLRGEWEWKHFDLVVTGNYIGDFRDDPSFDAIARAHPRNVPSYITLDLQLSYEWKKPPIEPMDWQETKNASRETKASSGSIWQRVLWGTRVIVGVNNAFDRNPPTVLAAFNDNYDTSLYSIRNRYWYVAVSKKF